MTTENWPDVGRRAASENGYFYIGFFVMSANARTHTRTCICTCILAPAPVPVPVPVLVLILVLIRVLELIRRPPSWGTRLCEGIW